MPKHEVKSYDALRSLISELNQNGSNKLYILFTADKDENAACPLIRKKDEVTGKVSWCSDCNQSFPLLEECSNKFIEGNENLHFITCYVGDRDSWKSPNKYRTELDIQSVPTLQNWQDKSKISEGECLDKDAIARILKL